MNKRWDICNCKAETSARKAGITDIALVAQSRLKFILDQTEHNNIVRGCTAPVFWRIAIRGTLAEVLPAITSVL
jgi:hypothetical protein